MDLRNDWDAIAWVFLGVKEILGGTNALNEI